MDTGLRGEERGHEQSEGRRENRLPESGYSLSDLLQVTIPFTSESIATVGGINTLKKLAPSGWESGWETAATPKRNMVFGSRFPCLVKLRTSDSHPPKAWVMNNGIVSDLATATTLFGEWTGSAGTDRYEDGYRKMAAGDLYVLPLTEEELKKIPNVWSVMVKNH